MAGARLCHLAGRSGRLAIRFILLGSTLTEAAHGAGFADAVHFSHTMRSLFGLRADRSLRQLNVKLLD
jgi:AraC-like DNA-binding protein